MARSVHTRPRRIRAVARLQSPYEPRGRHAVAARYGRGRLLKRHGLFAASFQVYRCTPDTGLPLPRVRVQRPRPGMCHPASPADVRRLLRRVEPECIYGLGAIDLDGAPERPRAGALLLGRLVSPGRIILYEQPVSPWQLPGILPPPDARRLRRAGATVEVGAGSHTSVIWPGETLRDFMLFDVLLHEIGHHVAQHESRRPQQRAHRTADHEAYAELFAARCRRLLRDTRMEAP
jgi:hypothetical protein